MDALLVITNLPDRASAERLAALLIERRLAACINLPAACNSVYRWEGRIERAEEQPLLIRTAADRYAELEAAIRAEHPYELPEIVAVSITHALPDYLRWLESETRAGTPA